MMNDRFHFFIPANVEKATNGSDDMIVYGIASTKDKDQEGEYLDPSHFDIDPLLKTGFVNWNHEKDPSSILGYTTDGKITEQGLFLRAKLYKESKKARDAYALAKMLQENPDANRRLGWSIEGQALERDSSNPKRVTRARITGVALTPSPVNQNTFVNVLKGNFGTQPVFEKSKDSEVMFEFEDVKNNRVVKVLNDLKVVVKPLEKEKSLNTVSGAALIREELEGGCANRKKIAKSFEAIVENVIFGNPVPKSCIFDVSKELGNDDKTLQKGYFDFLYNIIQKNAIVGMEKESLIKAFEEVGLQVPAYLKDGELEKALEIATPLRKYEQTDEAITTILKSNNISDDIIAKALEASKLEKAKDDKPIEKAEEKKDEGDEAEVEMLKMMKKMMGEAYDEAKAKSMYKKMKAGFAKAEDKVEKSVQSDEPAHQNTNIDEILKAQSERFEKSLKAITTIIAGSLEQLNNKISDQNKQPIYKAQTNVPIHQNPAIGDIKKSEEGKRILQTPEHLRQVVSELAYEDGDIKKSVKSEHWANVNAELSLGNFGIMNPQNIEKLKQEANVEIA